jgi:hypothetical protein
LRKTIIPAACSSPRYDRRGRQRDEQQPEDVAIADARGKDHRADNHDDRQRGAEIRLQHDETNARAERDRDGEQRIAEVVDPLHAPLENGRDEEDEEELSELG